MSINEHSLTRLNRGVGLIEVMISVIIAMLLVLVIYQVYEISEGQKRTITGGSDAQQNASYGMYVLGRDLAMAGNGIAPALSVDALKGCPFDPAAPGKSLVPIPVILTAGDPANDPDQNPDNVPDTITVFYGTSGSLSTSVPILSPTADKFETRGPVAFNPNDLVVAFANNDCKLIKITAVNIVGGFPNLTYALMPGYVGAAPTGQAINLGAAPPPVPPAISSGGRFTYWVPTECAWSTDQPDPTACVLRSQNQVIPDQPVIPVVSDVVNLKAQYGLDTGGKGNPADWMWCEAKGEWAPESLQALPADQLLAKVRQVVAVRIAIVTRSTQHEKDPVTTVPLSMFYDDCDKRDIEMTLKDERQNYRYKVLQTVVPLRNALWNTQ